MDLIDAMRELPTAAENKVRRLREQLDELTSRGERWSAKGRRVSKDLDLAVIARAQEDTK